MFRSINRRVAIGVWFALLTIVAGVGLLSGAPITMRSGAFWFFVVCSVPSAVMLVMWHGDPPLTAAAVIHAADQKA